MLPPGAFSGGRWGRAHVGDCKASLVALGTCRRLPAASFSCLLFWHLPPPPRLRSAGAGRAPGDAPLPVLCRMLCLALMKARMSESVWLSPVRGTDDTGLSGMLETTTSHPLLRLMFGPSMYLSKPLWAFGGWISPEALPPPGPSLSAAPTAVLLHPAWPVSPGPLAQSLRGSSPLE